MKRSANYKADLLAELKNDPEYAAEYLSAAKADSNEAFLVALRDVAEAQKGMKKGRQRSQSKRQMPPSLAPALAISILVE